MTMARRILMNCLQHVNKQKHPAGPETVRVKRIFFFQKW